MPLPLEKFCIIRFQLAEVALQQALESLAVAGLIVCTSHGPCRGLHHN